VQTGDKQQGQRIYTLRVQPFLAWYLHEIVSRQEIIPGVLQATHGWKEANVNALTHDDILDPIDGFPVQKGVAVKVERVL